MDIWLIFHNLVKVRWSDGVYYVKPIIGFGFFLRGRFPGKSGKHKADLARKSGGSPKEI
jgi:hypothetical protein